MTNLLFNTYAKPYVKVFAIIGTLFGYFMSIYIAVVRYGDKSAFDGAIYPFLFVGGIVLAFFCFRMLMKISEK